MQIQSVQNYQTSKTSIVAKSCAVQSPAFKGIQKDELNNYKSKSPSFKSNWMTIFKTIFAGGVGCAGGLFAADIGNQDFILSGIIGTALGLAAVFADKLSPFLFGSSEE